MFTNRVSTVLTLIAAFISFQAIQAQAQNDPFDGVDPNAPAAQAAADPAASAPQIPANDKSVLAGEHADHEHHAHATRARPNEWTFCRCIGDTDAAAVHRIKKALNQPLASNGLEFTETPLEEVVHILREEFHIEIQLDTPALDAEGIDSTEPVTINLHNISLRSAMRLMLRNLGLTTIIRDEVLLITTRAAAEKHLVTCVYDVRGLVEDGTVASADALRDTIISCVSSNTWASKGNGEGEIRAPGKGMLVISQTQAVHEEINSLLNAMRETRNDAPAAQN